MKHSYIIIFCLGILAAFLVANVEAAAQTITGPATVRDGDTIVVNRVPVRLNGLACPELNEPGGWAAKKQMIRMTKDQLVTCMLNGERTRDRMVGICTNKRGMDFAAKMVASGACRDCERFSGGRYRKYETAASRQRPLHGYCIVRQ